MRHNNTETHIKGRIKRNKEIPEDLIATNSKLSPRFPKVIIDEIRMAIGIESVSSVAPAYHKNFPIVRRSSPLPTRSSIYFQRFCITNTKKEIKKAAIKGPMNALRMSLSNFLITIDTGR